MMTAWHLQEGAGSHLAQALEPLVLISCSTISQRRCHVPRSPPHLPVDHGATMITDSGHAARSSIHRAIWVITSSLNGSFFIGIRGSSPSPQQTLNEQTAVTLARCDCGVARTACQQSSPAVDAQITLLLRRPMAFEAGRPQHRRRWWSRSAYEPGC